MRARTVRALGAAMAVFLFLAAPAGANIRADGNPFDWGHEQVKRLDARNDLYWFNDGRDRARDLIAFYYHEGQDDLVFRIDVQALNPGDEGSANYYILLDYAPGGQTWLPDDANGQAQVGDGWDLAVAVYDSVNHHVYRPDFFPDDRLFRGAWFSAEHDMIEIAVEKPSNFPWGGTVKFEVYTTKDGTDGSWGEIPFHPDVADAMADNGRGYEDGWLSYVFTSNDRVGSAKVAFVNHGNQGVTWSDVFRGRMGHEGQSGFDEILRAHDTYDVKGVFHVSGTLISAAQWHDPAWNQIIRDGVQAGRYEVQTSAYGQHIMPFFTDDINDMSIALEREWVWRAYGYDANTAWIPERSWEYVGAEGVADWIGDNWGRRQVDAVVLDDVVHGWESWNPHKLHQIRGGPKVFFRSDPFSSAMHGGDSTTAKGMFMDFANARDQEQILIYADDWEMPAQTGNWEHVMGWALTAYWEVMKYIGAHPWCQSVKLDNVLAWGWRVPDITIGAGAHPSIGGGGGYGGEGYPFGRNSWYNHWAGFVPTSVNNGRNYGQAWSNAHWNITHAPDNAFRKMAWLTFCTNIFETGWHDGLGGPISGWQHNYSTHIKNSNVHAAAAQWLADPARKTEAFWWDMDDDGWNEVVVRNDRLMAVFEENGGRLVWLFDDQGNVVAGNDNAYWEGTSGDFNDANHVGVLSDVWDGSRDRQHASYRLEIEAAGGPEVRIRCEEGGLQRWVTLREGERFLDVTYQAPDFVNVRSGFSPGLLSLSIDGDVLERMWGGWGGYAGWRNPNTGTVGAVVLGAGGASHMREGEGTLLKWDEVYGQGRFRFLIYAGPGDAATLDALSATVR